MPLSEVLVERVRTILHKEDSVAERRMFGGMAFMINGNMCCGVVKNDLMLRLGEAGTKSALQQAHTRPMDFTKTPMKTMVYVDAEGVSDDGDLKKWVRQAVRFARALPPKSPAKGRGTSR